MTLQRRWRGLALHTRRLRPPQIGQGQRNNRHRHQGHDSHRCGSLPRAGVLRSYSQEKHAQGRHAVAHQAQTRHPATEMSGREI